MNSIERKLIAKNLEKFKKDLRKVTNDLSVKYFKAILEKDLYFVLGTDNEVPEDFDNAMLSAVQHVNFLIEFIKREDPTEIEEN